MREATLEGIKRSQSVHQLKLDSCSDERQVNGIANFDSKTISLDWRLPQNKVRQAIRHEIAHALVGHGHDHDDDGCDHANGRG